MCSGHGTASGGAATAAIDRDLFSDSLPTSNKLIDLQTQQQQQQNITTAAAAAFINQPVLRDRVILTSQNGDSLTSESEYV